MGLVDAVTYKWSLLQMPPLLIFVYETKNRADGIGIIHLFGATR
jgi:hypothetical protein